MEEAPQLNGSIASYGQANYRGRRRRFGIKTNDRRKHVYIIGKTGMGKSTVLENMTVQDILAGRGVAVVDLHGEYAEKILDFIPPHRTQDVIYFNPGDTEFPVAFNIMEKVEEDQRHLVSSGLLGVFKKIWPDVWSPRMEYLLANAILALLEIPDATLLGVNRIFREKDFRRSIVSRLRDPIIRGFWENEFAKYPEQFMREAVASIQNKVGQFSSNPLIRNIIGQTSSSFDMRKMMDDQKIFIVNLSKGRIGEENSRLLGAMIVTKLYLTAMSRVDIPEPDRKDFYLYVDEFQNFATESFANILSEARKYRLNLTVAHQYVNQMEEEVQHAIFGNVGTMIVFRVGAEDAELLEKEFMPEFMGQDLVNLGFAQIYTKLMIDGITSRPFSAETLPPFPLPAASSRDAIVKFSRERYAIGRSAVEEKIRAFTQSAGMGMPPASSPSAIQMSGPHVGREPEPSSTLPKADRPMYEARCAVDGKPILVPFKPDGKRPVYCDEHMDMIKFRAKASEVKDAVPASVAPGGGMPAFVSQPPRGQPQGRNNSIGGRGGAADAGQRNQNRTDRNSTRSPSSPTHLRELRAALQESLRDMPKHSEQPQREHAPQSPVAPAIPTAPPAEPRELATRTLEPGETLKLD